MIVLLMNKRLISIFIGLMVLCSGIKAQEYKTGDLNKDGVVDVLDVQMLVNIVNGSLTPEEEEKVKGDKENIEEFQIMNDFVADFFSNSRVDFAGGSDSRYASSFFNSCYSQSAVQADQPRTKVISFEGSTTKARVMMSNKKDFSLLVLDDEVVMSGGKGSFELKNFEPGMVYYYKVVGEDGAVLTEGALKTVGQVRMIKINEGYNIRDLGGFVGLGGKRIKYGQLYRGASLGGRNYSGTVKEIGAADKKEMVRLGIKAVLDLRANPNLGKYPSQNPLEYHDFSLGHTPIPDADYMNIMTDYGEYVQDATVVSDVAWIISELKQGRPVYFNCRQGADRTGSVAFVIEGLLGCYEQGNGECGMGHQMALDYEMTSFSCSKKVDNTGFVYRSANGVYNNSAKIFSWLTHFDAASHGLKNIQEVCYYFLNSYCKNRTWNSPYVDGQNIKIDSNIGISKEDLDWFIKYMLDLKDDEYVTPSFAI